MNTAGDGLHAACCSVSTVSRRRGVLVAVVCAVVIGGGALLAGASQQSSNDLDVVPVRSGLLHDRGRWRQRGRAESVRRASILVDTGSAQMADAVLAAVKRLTDRPIRYVINTSADADHVGGNEKLSKAGQTILGHPGSSGVSEEVYTSGGAPASSRTRTCSRG